ncbi:MAG: ComF family protein [Brachybacterium tyrofermentans]
MDHAITTTAPDGTIGVTGGADPAGAGTEGGSSSTTWNPLPLIREIAAQTCSLVTPRHCPCGEEGTWLCRRCAGLLAAPAIRVESCCDALQHLTAARVHAEQHGGVLLPAGVDHTPILPVLALGEYSGPLQRLVLAIARLAADAEQTCPALVPVPSRLGARLRRGEDHTAELVRELARTGAGRPLLLRSTPTTAQEGQGSRQRRTRQIRLAGHAARRAGQERSAVIIVDDVVTTGSTLRGMHEALTGAGMTVLGAAVVASARLPVREQGEIF